MSDSKKDLTIIGKIAHLTRAVKFDENGQNGKIRLFHPIGIIIFLFAMIMTPFICAFREESSQVSWLGIINQICLF
jgi:hypothetical protein